MNMNTTMRESGTADPSGDRRQGKRLDEIAFALILIMTGGLWLAPKGMFPEGAWLVAAGLIILGLNATRRFLGIKTSGFGIIVGLFACAAGIGRIVGQELPLVPILLIVLGAGLVVRAAAGGKNPTAGPDIS
jgi:hypothetical protein